MNAEPTDTHNQEASSEFTKPPVPKPSVKIQNMESLFGNILQQMTKSTAREEPENTDDDEYEKLVDQVDNELSDYDSEYDSEYDSDYDSEYDVDNRWEAFNKLLDSHQSLCDSFRKLMEEDNE